MGERVAGEESVEVEMEWTIRHRAPRGTFPGEEIHTAISRRDDGWLMVTCHYGKPGASMEGAAVAIPPALIGPLRRCLNGTLCVVQQPDPEWERHAALVSPPATRLPAQPVSDGGPSTERENG